MIATILAGKMPSLPGFRILEQSYLKAPAQNQFGDQAVGAMVDADPHAKVEFPLGRKVQIDDWDDLMLLIAKFVKTRHAAQRAVIFHAEGNPARQLVAQLAAGGEFKALV